jgi:hypothetical protein
LIQLAIGVLLVFDPLEGALLQVLCVLAPLSEIVDFLGRDGGHFD